MASLRRRLPAGLWRHKPAAPEPDGSSTTPAEEALLPRWLRPSVKAARVASLESPAPRERRAPLLFAAPADGVTERLVIRYDLVQLLDRPDEALGMPVGELDTGDEIEVIERDAIWAHVRTPAQRDGWVPAMTLAPADALVQEPDEAVPQQPDAAPADGDMPALEDLLAIAAERRALAEAQLPAAQASPAKPPKPTTQRRKKRPDQARKTKKTSRRTSSRKKRH